MALYISSLNSGSNGNCYYVGNEQDAILIDAGISCREIEKRMKNLELKMDRIKAVFISHEHSDHIKGLTVLSRKYNLPVYINNATRKEARLKLNRSLVHDFEHEKAIKIGTLFITAFSKNHDAVDPYSFTVSDNKITIGVFTDIGCSCNNLVRHFKECTAAFLESNYDEEMLENGNYPYLLKKRIRGGKGHLSNKQALDLFLEHKSSKMTHLLLSHLSKNNNRPEIVKKLFKPHAGSVKIIIASRYEATAVHTIGVSPVNNSIKSVTQKIFSQLKIQFD